jgi:hypothetical protein
VDVATAYFMVDVAADVIGGVGDMIGSIFDWENTQRDFQGTKQIFTGNQIPKAFFTDRYIFPRGWGFRGSDVLLENGVARL